MSQLVFAAPPVITAPVRGRSDRVPIRRIFCVGRNYEAHAREMGVAVDREAPSAGLIELIVNGELKQRADISQLIHKVPEVIAHLSTFYHLHPGDLIYTGTPEGVGPVTPGDALAGTIAGVGTIALTIGPAE